MILLSIAGSFGGGIRYVPVLYMYTNVVHVLFHVYRLRNSREGKSAPGGGGIPSAPLPTL